MDYEINTEEKARCLECGDEIKYGRHDRKFCCDNCKNKFNNRRRMGSRTTRIKVLSALNKNYRILSDLLRHKVTNLSVAELQQLGFKFDFVTSYQKVRRHDVFLCFDISFTVMAGNVTSIEKLCINLPFVPEFGDDEDDS
ncbi:MAG: hypothetical protein LUC24_07140 [Bacteroidales bacterium]|nr:hypothetical protein [Bacteroidales bacterium]